jgi:hypothetical protein
VVDERADLRRGVNNNVIATDIRRREGRIAKIVYVYDQSNTQLGDRPARKLNWPRVVWHTHTVLTGDFDAHSIPRDPRCRLQRDQALWEDVSDENGLEIGNNDREVTHHSTREGHEGELFST